MSTSGERPHNAPNNQSSPAHPPRRGDTPEATFAQVDRLSTLLSQVSQLLDGSISHVVTAREALAAAQVPDPTCAEQVVRELNSAAERLELTADLVHSALQSNQPLGSPILAKSRPVTLGEAVEHALDVLRIRAFDARVKLHSQIAAGASVLPAGALYTVILNAVQNAVEACERSQRPGEVSVSVVHADAPAGIGYGRDARDWFMLEVLDTGDGPPPAPDSQRVFDMGFTTKPRGAGVGLAVARSVVQGLGGTIELLPKPAGRGALFRVRFPSPVSSRLNIA